MKIKEVCEEKASKKIRRQHETKMLQLSESKMGKTERQNIILKDYLEQIGETIAQQEKQTKQIVSGLEELFKISKIEYEVSGIGKILENLANDKKDDKARITELEKTRGELQREIKNLRNRQSENILNFDEKDHEIFPIPKDKNKRVSINNNTYTVQLEKDIAFKSS